jgi:hypothetical protein
MITTYQLYRALCTAGFLVIRTPDMVYEVYTDGERTRRLVAAFLDYPTSWRLLVSTRDAIKIPRRPEGIGYAVALIAAHRSCSVLLKTAAQEFTEHIRRRRRGGNR